MDHCGVLQALELFSHQRKLFFNFHILQNALLPHIRDFLGGLMTVVPKDRDDLFLHVVHFISVKTFSRFSPVVEFRHNLFRVEDVDFF